MSRCMRVLVMFDLPTNTVSERRDATKFRNFLLKDGYHMVQYSVYSRVCSGIDDANKHETRLKENLPNKGAVRMMVLTEKQYVSQRILLGNYTKDDEEKGGQIEIF